MCKHVAATLYGVGARLDAEPELFFRLRRVDQLDLSRPPATANSRPRSGGGTFRATGTERLTARDRRRRSPARAAHSARCDT
jgi:uncharacterized Zn finger protein